jgi:hypothetical protein
MDETKPFERPICVSTQHGPVAIASVRDALDFLSGRWTAAQDITHRDAVETCLKVLDGHRSTVDGFNAFRAAAKASGLLLVEDSAGIGRDRTEPTRLRPRSVIGTVNSRKQS